MPKKMVPFEGEELRRQRAAHEDYLISLCGDMDAMTSVPNSGDKDADSKAEQVIKNVFFSIESNKEAIADYNYDMVKNLYCPDESKVCYIGQDLDLLKNKLDGIDEEDESEGPDERNPEFNGCYLSRVGLRANVLSDDLDYEERKRKGYAKNYEIQYELFRTKFHSERDRTGDRPAHRNLHRRVIERISERSREYTEEGDNVLRKNLSTAEKKFVSSDTARSIGFLDKHTYKPKEYLEDENSGYTLSEKKIARKKKYKKSLIFQMGVDIKSTIKFVMAVQFYIWIYI